MKNIAAQMINFDREQMRRIANNMPEQYDEKPQVQQVAQIINGVFSQLLCDISGKPREPRPERAERNPPSVGYGFP